MAAEIALTFDDGPNPDGTRSILRLLDEHRATATFFVWGERAAEHPDVVEAVLASGHSVQPHCWAHDSHWSRTSDLIREDIGRVTALLHELGAPAPRLWRPPYGHLLRGATRSVACELDLELAGWTINPADYEGTDAPTMYREICSQLSEEDTLAVALLHDGHRESGPVPRRTDVSNTRELARLLLADGERRFTPLVRGVEAGLREGPT